MFGGEFSYQLCSSLWFDEVVLTIVSLYHIHLVLLYASISTCRGNSIKIFKFHEYVLLVFIQIYMHISRGSSLYSLNLGEFIHIIFWNFQDKWVSSIPSPPYALCIKLTWIFLSLQKLCCHQLPKRGRLKASRLLIWVLVINYNGYGLTIAFEMMCIE